MVMEGATTKKPVKRKALTPRAAKFCELVVSGLSYSDAYKQAYAQPHLLPSDACNRAMKIMANPQVVARIEWHRKKSQAKTLLTLHDRLALLAEDAQVPAMTASERNARARSIEVYTKISGGFAPERHEITGAEGGPIAVTAAVQMSNVPLRQKFEALRRAKAERNESHH